MALKLRVISDHYKALGKRSSRLFGVTGGRIGRSQDNDWVLPDPDRYVSSHHCKVAFRAGQWILEDTSTNGVFINGSDTPASVDGAYSLQDGDRIRLGDYEIIVSVDERNDFPADASGQMPAPIRVQKETSKPAKSAKSKANEIPLLGDDLGEELDITDLLSDPAAQASINSFDWEPPPTAPHGSKGAAAKPAAAKPAAATPAPPVPTLQASRSAFASLLDNLGDEDAQRTVTHGKRGDDWQMQTRPYDRKTMTALTGTPAPNPGGADVEHRARRATDVALSDSSSGVEAFCRGAGIDPSTLPSDMQTALLTMAGQTMRECVLGLMEALRSRADTKNRLRLSQTTIQPGENNPLKFSASVDEAMLKLLAAHGSRYLGPVEAIRDSFADLRTHQTAIGTAVQAATDELMNRLEPGEMQERFDRGMKRGALLGATNKMKYWDLYQEYYQALNQRNDQGLPTVFAEELARTYAERLSQKKK